MTRQSRGRTKAQSPAPAPEPTMFPVEIKDVEMPPRWNRKVNEPQFPFDKLEPSVILPDGRLKGPSFFVPEENDMAKKARTSTSYWMSRLKVKFAQRTVTENGIQGVRIWRRPDKE